MSEFIRVERDTRGVATLWLARPDKHNALSSQMMEELEAEAQALAADQDVRVVVLAADGPTFCAGGDLAWMRAQMEMDADTRRFESGKIARALGALAALPQPLIGRIHANAFGGGVGLACVCDVTVAAQGIRMGLTEVRLGLIPANIGPYVVARMGLTRARRVFMSGRLFDADEALSLDILSKVVPPEDLDATIEAEVAPYLACAPGAVADAKRLLAALGGDVTQSAVELAMDALADRWQTEEAAEGISAFFDKRKPQWVK
ncbi:crotonase/enoyl-CoA hydratase family protein [Pseudoprimorskyibacter insulae]|uniref:Putative enoyl-CoA hydratase echA8 n=1 Tax=Pseudoprimorskyibacter insulae TaxID=1695997 RepID=A0A2R8AXF7_9RHOB|nr:crotonase/enoyl-CoA hydratase family protein [Pseudoprimorskyibacter insulae]SPF80559.1 putative enoyl-CoA hydratase echA8 [Pseudoprimorskyibacter insulae]